MAFNTLAGDIGNDRNLTFVAAATALARAGRGGAIPVSPTPRTPNG